MPASKLIELDLMTLIYVSRSALALDGDVPAVDEIVRTSISRNPGLKVTGALIYTQLHFAQVLEGPALALDVLIRRIQRDARHRDVTIVAEERNAERKFADWSMVYSGRSPYLDRYLKPLISPSSSVSERQLLVVELVKFMRSA